MCGIDAISTHPGKNKGAKPANKDWSFQNLFIGALATACPRATPVKKTKSNLLPKIYEGTGR